MYQFIVLGMVPGTNIQITFKIWLIAVAAMVDAYLLAQLWRSHNRSYMLPPTISPDPVVRYNFYHRLLGWHK